jgi:hypothetical protein
MRSGPQPENLRSPGNPGCRVRLEPRLPTSPGPCGSDIPAGREPGLKRWVIPKPGDALAQGLAGQERQAFAALVIEAASARGAVEADVFQMPQRRVHGRRPRLRGAADFVAGAHGSETAPAGQPSFGHRNRGVETPPFSSPCTPEGSRTIIS